MLSSLLVLGILAYIAWPHYVVYRLDQAIMANDRRELEKLLDLQAIRKQFKRMLDQNIEGVAQRFDNPVFKFLRGGVKEVGSAALEDIDSEWVRNAVLAAQKSQDAQPRPFIGGFSFAFFESPTRFLLRAGELDKNPVHLYMSFQRWQWRVTAVFI